MTLLVGLTGGLASGKSTVARWLAEGGCRVVDADRVVADLYRPGEPGAAAVEALFGRDALDASGAVDHRALAARVFADAAARRQLEAAVHPLVRRRFAEIAAAASEDVVVLEATLLVEAGFADAFDLVVSVEADPEVRHRRAVRRGLSPAEARSRLAAQGDGGARRARADRLIHNDGDRRDLRRQVEALLAELRQRAAAAPAVAAASGFVLVTGNPHKRREAERILGRRLEAVALDLPEIQSLDLEAVLRAKGEEAWRRLGRPLVVEEAGLDLPALGGFPGPLVKWMIAAAGAAGLARTALALGDARATARCALLHRFGPRARDAVVAHGEVSGRLVLPPRGDGGFGWDPVFVPDGHERTSAEMGGAEKDAVSHRGRAWRALATRLRAGRGDGEEGGG